MANTATLKPMARLRLGRVQEGRRGMHSQSPSVLKDDVITQTVIVAHSEPLFLKQ